MGYDQTVKLIGFLFMSHYFRVSTQIYNVIIKDILINLNLIDQCINVCFVGHVKCSGPMHTR